MDARHKTVGPLVRYCALVNDNRLEPDQAQLRIARRLQELYDELTTGRLARKTSSLGWLFAKKRKTENTTKGLYIWGDVGRGKSMLMDLFHGTLPVKRKRRVHFHEFMSDVHERIHDWRQKRKAGQVKGDDPIPPVADALAEEAWVLSFDEFQVTDIADAMILGRLFERLYTHNVVVVATSNVPPDELYRDGLNRALFLPFIAMLKERMTVCELAADMDYRLEKLEGAPTYYTPLGKESDAAVQAVWDRLTAGAHGTAETLHLKGRTLKVSRTAQGIARFTFDELCENPLGAADFLKIAHSYHTVVLERIPKLRPENRNEARRFVWLIDALYDNAVKLVASAEAEPDALYPAGDTAFEFQRTASRLIEMRSHDYLALPHGRVSEHQEEDRKVTAASKAPA